MRLPLLLVQYQLLPSAPSTTEQITSAHRLSYRSFFCCLSHMSCAGLENWGKVKDQIRGSRSNKVQWDKHSFFFLVSIRDDQSPTFTNKKKYKKKETKGECVNE